LAGKSTLNRLEHGAAAASRYHRITHDPKAIEDLFVDLFLDAHAKPPKAITLDLDATDDPLHGHQEGRFFHGYHDCWCYLPLYVFCGRHLLVSKLRRANIDASAGAVDEIARVVERLRAQWPKVRITLRADSGFAREALMSWCEQHRVDYVFGLARNGRLVEHIATELAPPWSPDHGRFADGSRGLLARDGPRTRPSARAAPPGASVTFVGRPKAVGLAVGASSPKPSGCPAAATPARTRASSSPP
jgi:hypothetical protein